MSGYWFFVFVSMTFVLLASGWRKELFGELSHRSILASFGIGLALMAFEFQVGDALVNGAAIGLLAASIAAWFKLSKGFDRIHLVSVGMLLASVTLMLRQFYRMEPVYVHISEAADLTIYLALLAALFVRNPIQQWICVTWGVFLGTALYMYLTGQGLSPFGTLSLFSHYWGTFLAARLGSAAFGAIVRSWQLIAKRYRSGR